jgi:predicted secreted protein
MKSCTESENATEVTLSTGEHLKIVLPENRTAGFKWSIQTVPDFCHVLRDESISGGETPGASGTHIWEIEARRPGVSELVLIYQRSWEHQAAREYKLTLNARDR